MEIKASKIILARLQKAVNMDDSEERTALWSSIYAAAKKTAYRCNLQSNKHGLHRDLDENDVVQCWYTELHDGSIQSLSYREGDMLCGHTTISQDLTDKAEQTYAEDCAQYMRDLEKWEHDVATKPYSRILMNRKPRRPRFIQPTFTDHEDYETFGSDAWDKKEQINDLASIRFDRDDFFQQQLTDDILREPEEPERPTAPKHGTPEEWAHFSQQLRERDTILKNDRNNVTPERNPRTSNRLRFLLSKSDNTIDQDLSRNMRVTGKRSEMEVIVLGKTVRKFIRK